MKLELWLDEAELAAVAAQDGAWLTAEAVQHWCQAACQTAAAELQWPTAIGESPLAISVSFVDPEPMRALNARWRGRDSVTNVLSFPALGDPLELVALADAANELAAPLCLGDIVFCPERLRDESLTQGKALESHYAHLAVHAMLHLLGHDHLDADQAEVMESCEIRILSGLGYPNPYQQHPTDT